MERIKTLKQIYKQLLRLIITDEPMIKTTTGKVKRFEEVKKMHIQRNPERHTLSYALPLYSVYYSVSDGAE